MPDLSDSQRATLRALCDSYVPSIAISPDPSGFWRRKASDLGVDAELEKVIQSSPIQGPLVGLLDQLATGGFAKAPPSQRESTIRQLRKSSPQVGGLMTFFEKQTLLLHYGLPIDAVPNPTVVTYGAPAGQNPNWAVMGYPGPISIPPAKSKEIQTISPDHQDFTIQADVCVVGSGAGGAVVAARLAQAGRTVVVLEAGGHFNSADFHQLELWGYRNLWYRGGASPTSDGNVTLLAGGTLGGGTEINWMNCVRTPDVVRQDWAANFGMEDVNTPEFDRYMDMVEKRISSSQETSYYNAQNLRMKEGCAKLGYRSTQTHINWDPAKFNPLMAGYTGFGDQTGGKQTARRTYLLDAYRSGARIMVHCHAKRITVEGGRATGIEAEYADPSGKKAKVTVRAQQVVAACGSLETPALLMRSGIGGPAVGQNLHLQPGGAVYGVYADPQRGWWGSPMTANCEEFTNTGEGFGFYMEIPAFGPGFVASVIPWAGGRQHKELMTRVPHISTFIWFLRDRGAGKITVDANGNSVSNYSLTDELDQRNFRRATAEAIRIHEAAGAKEILVGLAHEQLAWKRGQNLRAFIDSVAKQPLLNGAQPMISAHQLSSCRMGKNPATSVADPNGQCHDTRGVWIADASACPTSLGANPMVTIMALAERTADRIIGARSVAGASRQDTTSAAGDFAQSISELMLTPFTLFQQVAGVLMGAATSPATAAEPRSSGATAMAEETEDDGMYSNIIHLVARKGQGRQVVVAIRDQAIPRIIQGSPGFIDEIVLQSDSVPDRITAISFWRTKDDKLRFDATGFAKVSELLRPLLAEAPQRDTFAVGSSTNPRVTGWGH